MVVILNNEVTTPPTGDVTLRELLEWRHIPLQGTAVALNDKLVKRSQWDTIYLKDNDNIVVISAAFGG